MPESGFARLIFYILHPSAFLLHSTSWTILRICIEERLVYRGDFALGTLARFLPIVTQVFLWTAVFEATNKNEIAGYTRDNFIAYYLLTMITRAFSSMPSLAGNISRLNRSGAVKEYLIQPVDLIHFTLLSRVAHKLVYYVVAAAPFAFVFWLCRGYFPGWPEPLVLLAFFASLIMSFLLGFFLEAMLGMIAFWLLEVSSLLFIYMLFNFFCSGHMFPIDMLPPPWDWIVRIIPLQYLAYFPSAVFLGKIQGTDLAIGLAVEAGWVVFFILACRFAYNRGIRRYSGYGG